MNPPTATDFKNYFDRDFPYGSALDTVRDADINRAITDAAFLINEAVFSSQGNFTTGYLYLAAHNLVMNLRASSQGVAGSFAWLENSKAVGGVSLGYTIPQQILDHPVLSILSKTNYGAKYLSLILPSLTGQVYSVAGYTKP